MTDKQIIIDGVDVSGCDFLGVELAKNRMCACSMIDFCNEEPNCYYKQLKSKKQSEEKLVKQIQTICDFINNRPEIFKGVNGSVDKIITDYAERKEQECEELKREIDIRSCASIELSLEFKKYKKAIDEIEEIADNNYENLEMERIFKIIGGLDV